jgi:hypothetical protein
MASVPPFGVDVVPSGFEQNKEWLDFLVSVLNLIATISIPFLLWWYSKQQGKQQEQQAAQQRLQAHVALLSDAGGNAMIVIGTLKQDCDAINRVYTDVFRDMQEVQGAGVTITRQQLQQVNTARKRLQGNWDNIMDDYRADLLGGSITDPRHGRMLLRGLAYMKLVEPLEAANFARMQASDRTVAPQESSESTETHVLPATVTNVTAGQDISTSQSLTDAAIKCRIGARASRYRWGPNGLGLVFNQSINQCYTCSYQAQNPHASHSLISRRRNSQLKGNPLSIESKLRDTARSPCALAFLIFLILF